MPKKIDWTFFSKMQNIELNIVYIPFISTAEFCVVCNNCFTSPVPEHWSNRCENHIGAFHIVFSLHRSRFCFFDHLPTVSSISILFHSFKLMFHLNPCFSLLMHELPTICKARLQQSLTVITCDIPHKIQCC